MKNRKTSVHSKLGASDKRLGIILVLPLILFMLVLVAYPLLNMFYLSTQKYNILSGDSEFVFLKNYLGILKNREFWEILCNTCVYAFASLVPCAVLGIIYAVVLNQDFPGRSIVRAFVIFPYLMPMVVCAATFRFMFNDLNGVLDHWIQVIGLSDKTINLFGNVKLAMIGVILVTVWKYTPMVMLAVLGRLQIIPKELYEAAKIDGANSWQSFWSITMPYILPPLVVVLLMRLIFLFNKWDIIYLLTGGGPLGATETMPVLLYSEAFSTYNFGKASAIGVVAFVIMLALSKVFYAINDKAERRM